MEALGDKPPFSNGSGEQQDLVTDARDRRKPCHYLHNGLHEGYITVLPKLYASILNKHDLSPVYPDGKDAQRSAPNHDSQLSCGQPVQSTRFVALSRFHDDPIATAKDNEQSASGSGPAQATTSIVQHSMRATDSLDRAMREGSAPLRPKHRPRPPLAQPYRPSPLRQSYRPSQSASSSEEHGGDTVGSQDSSVYGNQAEDSAMDGTRITASYGDALEVDGPMSKNTERLTAQKPCGQKKKNVQSAETGQEQGTSSAYPAVHLESGSVSGDPGNDKSSTQSLGNDQPNPSRTIAAQAVAASLSAHTICPQTSYGDLSQDPEVPHHQFDHTTGRTGAPHLQQQYVQPASRSDGSLQPLSIYRSFSTAPQAQFPQHLYVQQSPSTTTDITAPNQALRIQAADGQWYCLTPVDSSARPGHGIYEGVPQSDGGCPDDLRNHESG